MNKRAPLAGEPFTRADNRTVCGQMERKILALACCVLRVVGLTVVIGLNVCYNYHERNMVMKQIKLDDKRDLAIDGNEAWIIDYSGGLHNPVPGPHQCFNFANVTEFKAISPTQVYIQFETFDNQTRTIHAHIYDDFISFNNANAPFGRHLDGAPTTEDDILRIEQEYQDKLVDIHAAFAKLAKECERPENMDTMRLLEGKKSLERTIEDLTLTRHRKIEEFTQKLS